MLQVMVQESIKVCEFQKWPSLDWKMKLLPSNRWCGLEWAEDIIFEKGNFDSRPKETSAEEHNKMSTVVLNLVPMIDATVNDLFDKFLMLRRHQ